MAGRPPQFGILGPLEVVDGRGRTIEISGRKQRALLAILLLHANEVVPMTRLIDDLWGDEPPESAAKAVQISVSRLRKALGSSAALLETRPRGYAVTVGEEHLDLRRFDRLEQEGRQALARGDPEEAAIRFDRALALWRGPPLSEFAQEAFGHEVARLAERRLATIEERVDAELALGRQTTIVAELGHLVEEHPFRERLRGQLMLALARSGRQADALRVYDEGRRRLVDELGIEPGATLRELQRGILRQEPSVVERPAPAAPTTDAPAAPSDEQVPEEAVPPRRPPPIVLGGVGLLLLATAGAALLAALVTGGGEDDPPRANVVAVVDVRERIVTRSIDVGERPGAVAVGLGSVWVVSARNATLAQIDPALRTVERTIGLGFVPSGLAVGENSVWAADATEGSLVRLNGVTGARERAIDVGRGGRGPVSVAVGWGSVWAANSNAFVVVRIDPRDNRIVARIAIDSPRFIAAGPEGVWVVEATTAVRELDPVTNEASTRLATGFGAGGLALGANSVWVSDPAEDTVWRFDTPTRSFRRTIDVGAGPRALAFGSGFLWVANSIDDSVSMLDPETNEEVSRVALGGKPTGLTAAGGVGWVAVAPR